MSVVSRSSLSFMIRPVASLTQSAEDAEAAAKPLMRLTLAPTGLDQQTPGRHRLFLFLEPLEDYLRDALQIQRLLEVPEGPRVECGHGGIHRGVASNDDRD